MLVLRDQYVHLENWDAVFEIEGAPFVRQAVTSSGHLSVQTQSSRHCDKKL